MKIKSGDTNVKTQKAIDVAPKSTTENAKSNRSGLKLKTKVKAGWWIAWTGGW